MASGNVTTTLLLNSVPGFTDPAVRPPHGSLDAVVKSGVVSPNQAAVASAAFPAFMSFM
jgi:hypothetical protein